MTMFIYTIQSGLIQTNTFKYDKNVSQILREILQSDLESKTKIKNTREQN